jgi:bifunctional non-homologous end joining protein LigD
MVAHRSPIKSSGIDLQPMLASLTDPEHFAAPKGKWVFERKIDGFRAIAIRNGSTVHLLSRSQLDLSDKFPEIIDALKRQRLKRFIIDGEIAGFSRSQISFQSLQSRLKSMTLAQAKRTGVRVAYFAFDVLAINDIDARRLPLCERKRILKSALQWNQLIQFVPDRNGSPGALLAEACHKGWEGLIAKDANAPYVSGRSRQWLKLKCRKRQEFVIGGYTDPQGSRSVFGALLVGYYEQGQLHFAGKVGTGYSEQTLRDLGRQLHPLKADDAPFVWHAELPRRNVHWVKPKLVAEVEFTEWTRDRRLRHPIFLGLRFDKSPKDVVCEERNGPATLGDNSMRRLL